MSKKKSKHIPGCRFQNCCAIKSRRKKKGLNVSCLGLDISFRDAKIYAMDADFSDVDRHGLANHTIIHVLQKYVEAAKPNNGLTVTVSQNYIAKLTGLSRQTVNVATKVLRQTGYLFFQHNYSICPDTGQSRQMDSTMTFTKVIQFAKRKRAQISTAAAEILDHFYKNGKHAVKHSWDFLTPSLDAVLQGGMSGDEKFVSGTTTPL